MKKFLYKIKNLKELVRHYPFDVFQTKILKRKLSICDFFLFRNDNFDCKFIAENNLSLLTGENIQCTHNFTFFDNLGKICSQKVFKSSNYKIDIQIDKEMTNHIGYGSFTHHVSYAREDLLRFIYLKKLSFQNRGYTGYKYKKQSGYSFVHGNFGGLYIDRLKNIKSLSRKRPTHFYTPQFSIKSGFSYDLFFSNPTKKPIRISIYKITEQGKFCIGSLVIEGFGTDVFKIDDLEVKQSFNVSWSSHFPVGRAIIFKHKENHFDVLHT